MRKLALSLFVCLTLPGPAASAPERYRLDAERSVVGFAYRLAGQEARGTMPVAKAEVTLDLDAPAGSSVSATIDAAQADAGLLLATQAMRSSGVLDTGHFPTITFRSTRVVPDGETARVDGDLTIRGTTRPVTLFATIYRQRDTEDGDRDRLSIHLKGTVSRAEFGAVGYPDLVGDSIDLDILTRIDRVK